MTNLGDKTCYELILAYAKRGREEWARAPDEVRESALNCLGNRIAKSDAEVSKALSLAYYSSDAKCRMLLPMPKPSKLDWAFFVPIREGGDAATPKHSFHVCLLVKDENCLGLRFEFGHEPDSSHDYSHVQLSRDIVRGGFQIGGVPNWLPDSYPAIPVRARDSLEMFLCVCVSVHGFSGDSGMKQTFRELSQQLARPNLASALVERLEGSVLAL